MTAEFKIIPLGGLGEIGLNCMALVFGERILLIDAGLMFPDAGTMPGVDLVIPDFSYLKERADQVEGLVLTHGHEDHIGAVPFLLRELGEIPVYGTRLTLALVKEKLRSAEQEKLIEIQPRQKLELGPFKLEFIRVNHSILDGVAVAVETPWGAVIHTGDFKVDQASSDDPIDLYKFAEYGERGVLALLSDSTNADQPGCTDSETVVGRSLAELFGKAPGRVIVACFASSLARISQVTRAAKAVGRKVVFDGRGMINIVKLAKSLGYLSFEADTELTLAESLDWPDEQVVIVATGSQGEPMSALARMAAGEHRQVQIRPGDTVILSARSIPGHEKDIAHLVDSFLRQGAHVADGRRQLVHSSGHAQAEELKLMLNLTKPKYVVPVHGEMRHLVRHRELALSLGWAEEEVFVLHNGEPLILGAEGARRGEQVPNGRKVVDGNRLGEPEDPVLRNRLKLADGGLVVVTVVLSPGGSQLLAPPLVVISGVHYESDIDLSLETADLVESLVLKWQKERLEATTPPPEPQEKELIELILPQVRSLFKQAIKRRPTIWPQIIFTTEN